jgi:hypothetical protein
MKFRHFSFTTHLYPQLFEYSEPVLVMWPSYLFSKKLLPSVTIIGGGGILTTYHTPLASFYLPPGLQACSQGCRPATSCPVGIIK